MKSTTLAVSVFLGTALAVPPSTPQQPQITPAPTLPAWSAFKRAASSLLLPKPTGAPEKRDSTGTLDRVEVFTIMPARDHDRCPHGKCSFSESSHYSENPNVNFPPLAGVSGNARKPFDNAAAKGCLPVIQVTIPWWRTLVLYYCDCGDECPQVKRGCRLDAFIEIFTGNTLILYTCPPHCVAGALSLNVETAMQKRDLETKEEDACYSIMADGINNRPAPTFDSVSREFAPTNEDLPQVPVCLGFSKKLYMECVNRCNSNSPQDTDSPRCNVRMEKVYKKMLKELPNSVTVKSDGKDADDEVDENPGKEHENNPKNDSEDAEEEKPVKKHGKKPKKNKGKNTMHDYLNLAKNTSEDRMPEWCDWAPLPTEDDGNHGRCADVVREFCRWHDCHDG